MLSDRKRGEVSFVAALQIDAHDIVPISELLERQSQRNPDRLFVQDVRGGSATYLQTFRLARTWAAVVQNLGAVPHTTVATMQEACVEQVSLWAGLTMLRAWEVPIHPAFRGRMLEYTITNVEAKILVIGPEFLDRLAESADRLPTLEDVVVVGPIPNSIDLPFRVHSKEDLFRTAGEPERLQHLKPWDIAAIIYTSGTTGPSKGVMVPWGQLDAFVRGVYPWADLGEDDCFYSFTPSSHIGTKGTPYTAALLGGRVVLRPSFKIDAFVEDIKNFGVTTTALVSSMPHMLAQRSGGENELTTLRNLVMAPLIPDLKDFTDRFKVRICTAYSMTEIPTPIASDGWDVGNWRAAGKLRKGYPGIEARLVDENDLEVPLGVAGELILRTSVPWTVNSGYFGMPAETATAWRNGWFHTGDMFRKDEEGYFYFVDRLKDTIRRRGENISSFEVESVACEHPCVAECAAVAVPADEAEDEIKLCVVWRSDSEAQTSDLVVFMEQRLPKYMVPRYFACLSELPRTEGTLRVQKALLRENGVTDAWDRLSPQ